MSSGTVCSGLRTNLDLSGIDYLGLERVLKRGTGQVIEQHDQAVFVHDSVSGTFLLGCENVDLGADILKHGVGSNCHLLMVSDQHPLSEDDPKWKWGCTNFPVLRERFIRDCIAFSAGI